MKRNETSKILEEMTSNQSSIDNGEARKYGRE
jgi:hypothetical protein